MTGRAVTLTKRERFLRACRGEPCDRPPVWFMRQAGRYLPEYRVVRERVDFLTLCKTPELAAEVTFQPLRRYGFDAAILFADILLVPEAMGMRLSFGAGEGPRFADPIRARADVARLKRIDPERDTGFMPAAVREIRRGLPDGEALIGFAGAPFTLACYMVEGEGSTSFVAARVLMHADPRAWDDLMRRLTDAVADTLLAQVAAGADAVQLFDTWAGLIDGATYRARVAPHTRALLDRLAGAGVPRIYFAANGGHLLPQIAELGAEVVGLDWRTPLAEARRLLPPGTAVQGNLDPLLLLAPEAVVTGRAREILGEGDAAPGHVFNLGHGLVPATPPERVAAVVGTVRAFTSRHAKG
jgi:uroporphyrinogen decarboxylase